MKEYDIEIEEILRRVVSVKANNIDEAIEEVSQQYHNEEIVLDSSNFVELSINNNYSKRLNKAMNINLIYNPADEILTINCDDKSERFLCETVRDINSCLKTFSVDYLEDPEIPSDKEIEEELER